MATYPYRCREHGAFDVRRAIGTAEASSRCPTCGGDAIRVFSAPMLANTPHALARAMRRNEQSRDAPDVVTSIPSRRPGPRPRPGNPALQNLPRP